MRVGMLRMTNCLMIAGTDTALKRAELMAQGSIVDQPHAASPELRQPAQIVLAGGLLAAINLIPWVRHSAS